MLDLLKPRPRGAPLPAHEVEAVYRRQRRRVFTGIFIGYAAYYLVRNNLALAIPDILQAHPEYSKAQLGLALTGLSLALVCALAPAASSAAAPKTGMVAGSGTSVGGVFTAGPNGAEYALPSQARLKLLPGAAIRVFPLQQQLQLHYRHHC